jgi:hypothetical protein
MAQIFLDPTDQVERGQKSFAPRLDTLVGKTVGLLDINKSKGVYFLDRLEDVLRTQYGVKEVLRRKKVSAGKMASPELRQELREKCDAVIEALSD